MSYRITVLTKEQTIYSWIESGEDDHSLTLGVWNKPFPNTKEESSAFGILELLLQSDNCPPIFFEEEIIQIRIEEPRDAQCR